MASGASTGVAPRVRRRRPGLGRRFDRVRELVDQVGLEATWSVLVAAHARRLGRPSTPDVLRAFAGAGSGIPDGAVDLLEGLEFGEIALLYEVSLAHADHEHRKQHGQFFTPDDVADFMAVRAVRFPPGVWLDPCCGVGNLAFALARHQPDPVGFVRERLVLVDRDGLALRVACALLSLALEHEGSGPVFRALWSRARVGDALAMDLPGFDYAILNPPYVQVPADRRFESWEARDLFAYFVERMTTLGRGVVAIVPQSFTMGTKFAGFRRVLTGSLAELDVYCFDNVPDNVFRGVKYGSRNSNRVNSTRAAVIVGRREPTGGPADGAVGDAMDGAAGGAGPGSPSDAPRHRITPLLRWRATERELLLASADRFLAPLQPDRGRGFPKVGADLVGLFAGLERELVRVGDLLAPGPSEFPLTVPLASRYFVTAAKRALDRGHAHRLFFGSEADRDLAYVVLNSSLGYWWWRVFDGGFIVSRPTLASVPVPGTLRALGSAELGTLVSALEGSERVNVVVKLNAGMRNENVKHPPELLRRLNEAVAPGFADALLATHANSVLSPAAG